tara:strand:- start:125 stop:448 length:324 start_codon:yes stop_codon:yes gene_type:complete
MKLKKDEFETLRQIDIKNRNSQREMAKNLGFSLGKLNYCLNSLKEKGFIKLKNFSKSKNKLAYSYILTPMGFTEKIKLTMNYMNRKMKEYDELKMEFERLNTIKKKK